MNNKGCLTIGGIFLFLWLLGSLWPSSSDDIYYEAKSSLESNNLGEALSRINEAIQMDTSNSKYYELRGQILHELRDTLHSKEDFKRTLLLATSDSTKDLRIREMIEWDLNHGEIDKAKELLEQEIELYKNNPTKHIDVVEYAAREYLLFGDTSEAIQLYSQLSKEYPTFGKFNYQIGVLYAIINKNRAAIKVLKKAVELEPENAAYLYSLGITYLHAKNKKRAKPYLKKAMELGNQEACEEYRELTAKTRYYSQSRCCDGTSSSATGRGACSHHRGVCRIEHVPYKEYTIDYCR